MQRLNLSHAVLMFGLLMLLAPARGHAQSEPWYLEPLATLTAAVTGGSCNVSSAEVPAGFQHVLWQTGQEPAAPDVFYVQVDGPWVYYEAQGVAPADHVQVLLFRDAPFYLSASVLEENAGNFGGAAADPTLVKVLNAGASAVTVRFIACRLES